MTTIYVTLSHIVENVVPGGSPKMISKILCDAGVSIFFLYICILPKLQGRYSATKRFRAQADVKQGFGILSL